MHHLVFGINFQIHSVSLTILVSIQLLVHLSTHLSHHPQSHHPSHLYSFTPGSKPTFSTNPSHLRLLLHSLHDNGTGLEQGSITLIISFLVSHFNFLFIPRGKLRWLPVSILLHVEYTLSYRIAAVAVQDKKKNIYEKKETQPSPQAAWWIHIYDTLA